MNREVLQQALEFAEFVWRECSINDFAEEKRYVLENALRAELAKPDGWVPLTDSEIQQIAIATKSAEPGRDGYVLPYSFARAIEQAHNIKETK